MSKLRKRIPIAIARQSATEAKRDSLCVAGRVTSLRKMSRVSFFHVQDESGSIQAAAFRADIGQLNDLSIGDIVLLEGRLFETSSGELTLELSNQPSIMSKNGRHMPDRRYGIVDPEVIAKKRFLQILSDSSIRHNLLLRSELIFLIRQYLVATKFIEVETPILQREPTVGTASSFRTRSDYLETDLFLRGTCEIFLKQLVVAGMEKIFEIGKVFRNESKALIEFSLLEILSAYSDCAGMIDLVQELFRFLARHISSIDASSRELIDGPWKEWRVRDALQEHLGVDLFLLGDQELRDLSLRLNVALPEQGIDLRRAALSLYLIKNVVVPSLKTPTFLTFYPAIVSPLAKESEMFPGFTERAYLFIKGLRLCEVVTEQTDASLQAVAFDQQDRSNFWKNKSHSHPDLLEALSYGCPPTGGVGLNINRLVALFTGAEGLGNIEYFPFTSGALAR